MTRTAGIAGGLAAAATAAALIAPASPAAARQPDPPPPATGSVRPIEVHLPAPVHDWRIDAARMGVAASLGAALAARATAARLRRRPPPGTGLIELTDVVQSRQAPGVRPSPADRMHGAAVRGR